MPTEKTGGGLASPDPQKEAELLRAVQMLFGGEKGGYSAELTRMKNPSTLNGAIDVMSGVAIGLPSLERTKKIETVWVEPDGKIKLGEEEVEVIKIRELMQIFMSPDFMVDRGGAGYYARLALDQILEGSGRSDVLAGLSGPGMFSLEEAKSLVIGRVDPGEEDEKAELIEGRLKPDAIEVVRILAERSGEHKARKMVWKAFAEHQQAGGDEKAGADLFVTPGHSAPQGPDWQAFFDDRRVISWKETGKQFRDGTPEVVAVYESGRRDKALRVIYAAGLTFEELTKQGKKDLLIPGLHYEGRQTRSWWEATDENADKAEKGFDARLAEAKKETDPRKIKWGTLANGEEVLIKNMNIYAQGWGSEGFREWFDALEIATGGDLLAIYDAWYAAIATGLVADVAVKGKKVGDPPLTSSLHAWLMHFGAKQANEAGYGYEENGELGKRFKWNTYKGKTGPINGIGKYPAKWLEPFFKHSTIKERVTATDGEGKVINDERTGRPASVYVEKSIFDLWWTENRELATLNWVSTDRPDDSVQYGESEVGLNSYDGWLYNQFQLYKMLAAVQEVPSLRDLAGYTYWQGLARSLDKAFGMAYLPTKDGNSNEARKNQGERRRDWIKYGGKSEDLIRRREIVVDGVKFIQVVPDEKNPRMQLFMGILSRYSPDWKNDPISGKDTSVSISERFTHMSEKQIKEMVALPGSRKPEMIGVPIETFLRSVIDAGMLTAEETYLGMMQVYGKDITETIVMGSDWIRSAYSTQIPRRK